jgi:excinuclease ABC subunit C
MVKDDKHRTRGLYFNNVEIPIDKDTEAFKLLTRVQDEVHRFAIEYHRSLRTKEQVHSVLDDIPGIGPKRRRELMMAFTSLDDIRTADIETLVEKGKLPRRAAESLYTFFHKD